jgi:hypothetical protein
MVRESLGFAGILNLFRADCQRPKSLGCLPGTQIDEGLLDVVGSGNLRLSIKKGELCH